MAGQIDLIHVIGFCAAIVTAAALVLSWSAFAGTL
jgi:hypothetical protein